MKKIYISFLLIFLAASGFSQYYYIPYLSPGDNPGGLNTDSEFPVGGGLSATWNTILASGNSIPTYSSAQTIPFAFDFNGAAVTQYIVSNVGVLTFDVGTSKNPGPANIGLPTTLVPSKAICVWGLQGSGANDNIVSKTFGSAPNRQHWVFFSSYTFNGVWSYWSIVLEESTNKIYLVDQRHQNFQSGLTLGIQIDSVTAYQVSGSPNVSTVAGNNSGSSDNAYYEFNFGTQPNYDLIMGDITIPAFPNLSSAPFTVSGDFNNFGSQTITSFDLSYRVNGGSAVTASISSVSIATGSTYEFAHPTPWNPLAAGTYTIDVWTSNLNGNADENPGNDTASTTIVVSDPIPNIVDVYLTNIPIFNTVGSSSNQVNNPMDLDFHPDLNRKELWVVNLGTENSGGSTVTFDNAGQPGQSSQWKQDGNAWHFMSLPTGIAFSENGNFATSPGVYDANHDGGNPFTGPALWSSDPSIYAQPSGGNGSHLDMLHASPYSMGTAWEDENVFWVFDANSNDIVRYDFAHDHGPGNSDHDDGKIHRVTSFSVDRINGNIACHLSLDRASGWLYIVDGLQKRILRMDINSGSLFGTPSFGPFETLAQYTNLNGVTWEILVDSGLVEPAGIAVIEDRMIVGDHSNGDIVIYDISGTGGVELGRISTGAAGLMGLTIGPDGYIWYVNANNDEVVKIEQGAVAIDPGFSESPISAFPNPFVDNVKLEGITALHQGCVASVYSVTGKKLKAFEIGNQGTQALDLAELPGGSYFLNISKGGKTLQTIKLRAVR